MCSINPVPWFVVLIIVIAKVDTADDDYNVLHRDGSYQFGYNNPDSYHYADANRKNVIRGEFGGRNPKTGALDSTVYTAGPRGFRPRGKNIVRKYDLNQNGPRAVGSPDDPHYDPYEDPSYDFSFRTRTYNRDENANRLGDVKGRYSYLDDVGERHNVEYIAGKNTGFHVKTPFPDSNPRAYGPLYFRGRGKPIPRGRTSIQRGLDGSYKFVSAGPDQRRTESSDSTGHVRGSYTYLDDKGIQHSVHYIAGPETGYRVLKNVKGPHLPTVFPFGRPEIIPPDFYDDSDDGRGVFDTAASGHVKPSKGRPVSKDEDKFDGSNSKANGFSKKPKPTYSGEDDFGDFGDIFGGGSSTTSRPASRPGVFKPSGGGSGLKQRPGGGGNGYIPGADSGEDYGSGGDERYESPSSSKEDGSYKGSSEEGSVRPTTSRPGGSTSSKVPTVSSSEEGYGPVKPGAQPGFEDGYSDNGINDDFGLFGSESHNPRKPYDGGKRPIITIDSTNGECSKCKGTLVTNIGDRPLLVPPGISVRAHVQAIDLTAINPRVPSPREQYNAEMNLVRDRLFADEDNIVRNNNSTEKRTETTTTEIPATTVNSSKNSTTT